jgi:hypothetical protein
VRDDETSSPVGETAVDWHSRATRHSECAACNSGEALFSNLLFVGEGYLIRREIIALSESRRTESYWVRTRLFDAAGKRVKAEMLLNHATLKDSYTPYASASE